MTELGHIDEAHLILHRAVDDIMFWFDIACRLIFLLVQVSVFYVAQNEFAPHPLINRLHMSRKYFPYAQFHSVRLQCFDFDG